MLWPSVLLSKISYPVFDFPELDVFDYLCMYIVCDGLICVDPMYDRLKCDGPMCDAVWWPNACDYPM